MTTTPLIPGGTARTWLALPLLFTASLALAGDGHDLTFQGDASFGGPHDGQAIQAALVKADSGKVVAMESGTVSGEEPTFSFEFPGALKEGRDYEVHYWIDSNFGGGSAGACDPMQNDHQWSVALEGSSEAMTHVVTHDPSAQSDVCATFE